MWRKNPKFSGISNCLYIAKKGQPTQIINRGMGYVTGRAAKLNTIPAGHAEGLVTAFANIYISFATAVLKHRNGEALTESDLDFPDIEDGIHGVKFVQAVVNSNNNHSVWTSL